MNNVAKKSLAWMRNWSEVAELAAWLAILAIGATIFKLDPEMNLPKAKGE
jgi:hypothetical protein